MEKLKIQILARNDEDTIEDCLKSIIPLGGEISVIDFAATDKTLQICKKYGASVHQMDFKGDFSELRNSISGEGWNLMIHPYEILVGGHEDIKSLDPGTYYGQVLQDDLIMKDVRVWFGSDVKFQNPVYESIPFDGAKYLHSMVIFSRGDQANPWVKRTILDEWMKKEVANADPIYYSSCWHLSQRNVNEFLKESEQYLFQKPGGMSEVMTLYYSAIVSMHKKDLQKATRNTLRCLATKIVMAEFWCLLGDIYAQRNVYDKSKVFYENAMIMGSKRKKADLWPIEISKYKKYPEQMIEKCQDMIDKSVVYRSGAR